jgi:hypothetical protein
MKRLMRIWVVVFVFVGMCVMGMAQAEKPKGQLYFVEEVAVKLDKFSDYDIAIKEVVEFAKKHNYPHSWLTYSTSDMLYYFVYPIESESEIEALFVDWEKMAAEIGKEKWGALYDRLLMPTEYYKYYEIQHMPLQSYAPGDVAVTPMEAPATYWGFCYAKPGHTKDIMEIFDKYIELYKGKDLPAGFESYVVLTGAELPGYFYVMRGKTFTDLFGNSEKAEKIAAAEEVVLWKEFASHLRKYEYKLGMFRPDLSYLPEQK